MRVLLAHKFFKYNGGADVFFFETGRVLEENGHDVAYFSTQDNDNLPSKFSNYFSVAPKFKDVSQIQRIKSFVKIPYNFEAKKKFEKLVSDFNPEVIHVFNIITQISPSILDVARKKNIPVVISCNDYKHICPNYKLFHHGRICEDCKGGKFYNAIKNKCSHDSLLFSSASAIESYIHKMLNIYKKDISLFLFASDFMAYKTEEFWGKTIKWGKLLNPFKIPELSIYKSNGEYGLYFGRLIDEKGVDILIKALKKCENIPFKIVGDGPDLEKLQEIVKKGGLINVEFTGPIWGNKLNDIIANSRFVVVPSIWYENFPYVILQSFAQSKPVIGSNRGGIPELVIDSERGLLYNALDADDLSEKIVLLNNRPLFAAEMGINARKFIEETFTDDMFYNSIMDNYKKILK